jgi:short-subunit dehydrogenase
MATFNPGGLIFHQHMCTSHAHAHHAFSYTAHASIGDAKLTDDSPKSASVWENPDSLDPKGYPRMLKALAGRAAIVTGASRGLGEHIARALSRMGMNLALVARSGDALDRLAGELSRADAQAIAIRADLADLAQLDALVSRAQAALGSIDVLINNAGIDGIRCFPDESDAETELMLRVDLLSPMLLARKILPAMLAQGTGHIVNIASLAGKTSSPYAVSYATAKAGLIAFTHGLRAELRGTGVSASVISPGFVTGEGMFAKQERAYGVRVSRLVGTTSPERVAEAVLSALRSDTPEIVVNPGPIRLMQAFNQVAPDTMSRIQDRLGVSEMLRSIAVAERAKTG